MHHIFLPKTTHAFLIFERLVDKGSFGTVFFATDNRVKKPVAVKIIESQKNNNEMNIHSLIHHENIVEMYSCFLFYEKYYGLVMERIDGLDLYDLIQTKGHLRDEEAFSIFIQLFSAVRYLHSHLIIHRDIKPENILIGENGDVKLCDFGFSTFFDKTKKLSKSCGSLTYASPEMLRGEEYIGPEIDVWCMGIVLYMMVQGRPPLRKYGFSDICTRRSFKEIERKFKWSEDLESMLRGLLDNNKKTRLTLEDVRSHPWVTKRLDRVVSNLDVTPIVIDYASSIKLEYAPIKERLIQSHMCFDETSDTVNNMVCSHHAISRAHTNIEINMMRVIINSLGKYENIRNNKGIDFVGKYYRSSEMVGIISQRGYPESLKNVISSDCPEFHIYNMLLYKMNKISNVQDLYFIYGPVLYSRIQGNKPGNFYCHTVNDLIDLNYGIETAACWSFCFWSIYKPMYRLYVYCGIEDFTQCLTKSFPLLAVSSNPLRIIQKGDHPLEVSIKFTVNTNLNECLLILERGTKLTFRNLIRSIIQHKYDDVHM